MNMKEYIKKFESAVSADNYEITDIPFTTTISGNPAQNLRCNVEGKKLVNDNGTVSVQDGVKLISFSVYEIGTFQAESGMTWADFCGDNRYNTGNWYLEYDDSGFVIIGSDPRGEPLCLANGSYPVEHYDEIIPNMEYLTNYA